MIALVIAFYLLAFVPMIGGIALWNKKTDWKDECFTQIPQNGISTAYFGKPLGKALVFSSLFYFLGASLYLLLGNKWLWLSCVIIFIGFVLLWVLFFLFTKGTRSFVKTIKDWIGIY